MTYPPLIPVQSSAPTWHIIATNPAMQHDTSQRVVSITVLLLHACVYSANNTTELHTYETQRS